jgi:hypothetical protein
MDSRFQMQQESPSRYGTNRFLPTYLNLATEFDLRFTRASQRHNVYT